MVVSIIVSVVVRSECPSEPCSGDPQVTVDCSGRNLDHLCGLFVAEPAEVVKFDRPRGTRVLFGQAVKSTIKIEDLERGSPFNCQTFIESGSHPSPAPLRGAVLTCMVDQNSAHRSGGDCEEVRTIVPGDISGDKPDESLVHERGRLQRMSRPLPAEVSGCQ